MAIIIDRDSCVGCGSCVDVCPAGALSIDEEQISVCNEDECISCGTCVQNCPVGAISES